MPENMALADTRNQTWANDKSKFGYKMLQKMGWTEGKGLGVKEDGTTKHVRIRRKSTSAGVGGETNIDAWNKPAEVAAGLNAVLARLAPINCEKAPVKKEKVSKKGRGYYERRSAGKNVSGYSQSDLREIFGGIDVDQKTEEEKQALANDESDRDKEKSGCVIDRSVGNIEMADGTNRKQDEKAKRKKSRKERGKKAKTKSLGIEHTIKKTKKSKKGKKREAR